MILCNNIIINLREKEIEFNMLKKLLAFVCGVAPFGAMAADVIEPIDITYITSPQNETVNVTIDDIYAVESGNALVITGNLTDGVALNITGDATTPGDLRVFETPMKQNTGGIFYISNADTVGNPFSLQVDGDINVSGDLVVNSGRTFSISGYTQGVDFDARFANIDADGGLSITGVNNLTVAGSVKSSAGLGVSAQTFSADGVLISGGADITVADSLSFDTLLNGGADSVDITAGTIVAVDIQNNQKDSGVGGVMNITVTGNSLETSGNLENNGSQMEINAGSADVVVNGTMVNTTGTMDLVANSLQITGGDATNPSMVNNGKLTLVVAGETNLANGLDLNMADNGYGNDFSLTTGTLVTGGNIAQLFDNDLNSYSLVINSVFDANSNIVNGTNNENANMYLAANSLTVTDVINNDGKMQLAALDGDLKAESLSDMSGADLTQLSASGAVNVSGAVNAQGNINISGQTVELGSVVANGGALWVQAKNSVDGIVQINGDLENVAGDIEIFGRQMAVLGTVKNTSGKLSFDGSDFGGGAIKFGGMNIAGGTVSLEAKQGITIEQNTVDGVGTLGTGLLSVMTGGALNIGSQTGSLSVAGTGSAGETVVNIAGDVTAGATDAADGGDVNIALTGQNFLFQGDGTFKISGNVSADDIMPVNGGSVARGITFAADAFDIGSNVTAYGANNNLVFRGIGETSGVINTANFEAAGAVSATDGAKIDLYSMDVSVGGLTESGGVISLYGDSSGNQMMLEANETGISINNGILFDGTTANVGLNLAQVSDVVLQSNADDADIIINGGVSLASWADLKINSGRDVVLNGDIVPNGILRVNANGKITMSNDLTVGGAFYAFGNQISGADLTNNGFVSMNATNVSLGDVVQNSASGALPGELEHSMNVNASTDITANSIDVSGGTVDMTAQNLKVVNGLNVTNGTVNLDVSESVSFGGDVEVSGALNQGTAGLGMLNLMADQIDFSAKSLTVSGVIADAGSAFYKISDAITVNGAFNVAQNTAVGMWADEIEVNGVMVNNGSLVASATSISVGDVTNSGNLDFTSLGEIVMGDAENTGNMTLSAADGSYINMQSLTMGTGVLNVSGAGWNLNSDLISDAVLYQNNEDLSGFGINVNSDNFVINTSKLQTAGIEQISGEMKIATGQVVVNGDINVSDLTVAASPADGWLTVDVMNNVSGGVKFIGLEQMTIGGDYVFDKNSQLLATILAPDATERNYWSAVSLNDDDTLGQITNADAGEALIQVGGTFTSGVRYNSSFDLSEDVVELAGSQIGIMLNSAVDQGTAIWLLKSDAADGVQEFSNLEKIRNLNVLFCNADGTKCVSYLDSLEDGGAYISVRDTDEDGLSDSLYVVFDPRFGGPVLIEKTKLQPIVERQLDYTVGEYVAAGALDNLIAGQLLNNGFFNRTPIELIPYIFEGTNVENMMTELYNRMEYFVTTADGAPLARFSRLVQPREVEQLAGAIVLNEHTNSRSFEDRMFDEFIWNRNRNLNKAWADIDFGMFSQNVMDEKRVYGNRFSISGGFDWQQSDSLILGLTGRISHMSSDNSDTVDLSYLPEQQVTGNVDVDVSDTNIGLGAYLMKTLGEKFRLYGNAFVDVHLLNVKRNQTFVDTIDGFGSAFALTSEWGLMHDWLNQYVVGNLYARVGYNMGMSVTEEASDENYMDIESDGYMMLTPGYSLTAQKRIYPSAWFQVRPYATIGIEYDVLGASDNVQYKFASADAFSTYDVDLDPLWANIGGGIEMLSANGVQVGLDYRYQYNNVMQLHNIRVSGSYRF